MGAGGRRRIGVMVAGRTRILVVRVVDAFFDPLGSADSKGRSGARRAPGVPTTSGEHARRVRGLPPPERRKRRVQFGSLMGGATKRFF